MEGIREDRTKDVYTDHVQGTDDTDSEDDVHSDGGNNTERKKRKLNNIDVLDRRSVDRASVESGKILPLMFILPFFLLFLIFHSENEIENMLGDRECGRSLYLNPFS